MSDSRPPVVLITGAAGFLGAHLTRSLLADARYDDHLLLAVDDLSGGFRENLPESERVEFARLSVTDSAAMDQLFVDRNICYVFHLAAYAAEGLSHFIRRFNYTNNLLGSVNLINAAVRHEVRHFVFTSSIAVYGAAQVPMKEDMLPVPEDPYGISKLAVELDLDCARRLFGLKYTVFRPHNVYGEYQNLGDRYRNVVGIFMNRIMQGEQLPVFGDGSQKRAFSYVADLMDPLVSCPFVPEAAGEVFNVGASTPTSVLELAQVVCREFDVEPQLDFQPPRDEVVNAWSDHSKCDRVFGPSSSTSLEDGISNMAAWARQTGARSSNRFSNIEITRGLPPGWVNVVDE